VQQFKKLRSLHRSRDIMVYNHLMTYFQLFVCCINARIMNKSNSNIITRI
jgi:hypothetical protein